MVLLYNLGIFLYSCAIRIAALFNEKAKLMIAGRKNWQAQLQLKIDSNARYLWFHCASLGEFEQGRPVIEETKNQFPGYKIILTFFSPSGYEIRKNYEGADVVCYLPMDTKQHARTFLNIVKPEKVFFVKYEFWYNFITELKSRQIPLYIISAIFRENQQFFKNTPWGKWYRKILFSFEHFFIQNEKSGELLSSIGIKNFTISGDTRFDRVASIASGAKKFDIVDKFKGNSTVVIAGSTWKPDEELLIEFINNLNDTNSVKFIIAPHEVSASNINRIHQMLKKPAISFSKIQNADIQNYQVLIIDSIGILSSLYQYGNLAYIGGGFGVGIHNILEAATFALPILFGPNYKRFKEAVELTEKKGAFPIKNYNELKDALNLLLNDKNKIKKASETSKIYVEKNVGSTKLITKKVFNT
ncbi:3-deoxy-D-manno-octulosonic acid transferase [Prolixibacteraceae bacterium Z1-6]|uniref:3-deoxy-D-manno-octulosonic acid transferase n=1 Tax=Draconibacterium aestuarii TaxID=2998507 RepID=A0A9X3F4Y4_9BACT|nr:3-deoxy-D-manno-octulosonic acid transferase [Prolixibacteraceae bacterium Z1-6]